MLGEGFSCPSCGCTNSMVVSRKYLMTALRRCKNCQLLFRTPTTSSEENALFYQKEYTQGFTTECPSDEILAKHLESGFAGGEKDYSIYIDVIAAAGGKRGARLFDFGCSWGYGSWQFTQHGFEVESFELSVPRANFARNKLRLNVHHSLSDVKGMFDIFFSSHVLEHLSAVKDSIEFGMHILKPGGLFVAFTPNGSEEYRQIESKSWDKLWGLVHPNFLDSQFYKKTFSSKACLISSNPYPLSEIKRWNSIHTQNTTVLQLGGEELLVLVKK
jgi:2-polyprenyl-3-methyl-5-hydroxy-6-metoxy-1,4-benzoquinol methylase